MLGIEGGRFLRKQEPGKAGEAVYPKGERAARPPSSADRGKFNRGIRMKPSEGQSRRRKKGKCEGSNDRRSGTLGEKK